MRQALGYLLTLMYLGGMAGLI